MFRARKAFLAGDVVDGQEALREGFAKWRLVIDEFPSILDDEATTGDDLIDYIKHYREVLDPAGRGNDSATTFRCGT